MKRTLSYICAASVLLTVSHLSKGDYSDHRGYNLDSLEVVVSRWTPEMIAQSDEESYGNLLKDFKGLMNGYLQINGAKSEFYARKVLTMSRGRGYHSSVAEASRIIGQTFWAKEQYDSAAFYYSAALDAMKMMERQESSAYNPDGYSRESIDDGYSSLYGTLGNLYSMMGSLDSAFSYYAKAGEIFDRYGWNESNAVLHYNMGETWREEKEYDMALSCYEESLRYGRLSGDSLWIATPLKGLGALYLETGRARKGLRCLEEADKYFSIHEDQEFRARLETLDFMGQILREERRILSFSVIAALAALVLLASSLLVARALRRTRKEQQETTRVLDETIREITPSKGAPSLSDREREIMEYSARGMTVPQIAEKIFLSPETVKWYRKKLLVKFDAANIAEAISKAKDSGIL